MRADENGANAVNPTTIVFLLASLLAPQATRPAADPATTLSRAKLAEESGDWPKAEALLREASASSDSRVAGEARARLAVVQAKLGGGGAPKPSGEESPITRRVREAVDRMQENPATLKAGKEELSWIGEPAVPLLEGWILDPSTLTAVRGVLVETVAGSGGEAALSVLERLAGSPDELLRRRTIEVFQGKNLGVSEDRRTSVAARFLADSDPTTRRFALVALRNSPASVKDKLAALSRDPDARVREALVKHFSAFLPAEAAKSLSHDPASSVRREVARALKGGGWPGAARAAGSLIADSDPEVRADALQALGRSGIESSERDAVRAALGNLVSDPSPEVRRNLAWNARRILGAQATPLILSLLLDPEEPIAESAMLVFEQHSWEGRREDLAAILDGAAEIFRRYPFRDPAAGVTKPTIADRYFVFLAGFARSVAKPEDFGRIARLLGDLPSAAKAHPGPFGSLLSIAGPTGASFLCDLFDRFADPEVRTMIVTSLGTRPKSIPGDLHERVVTLILRALEPHGHGPLAEAALRLGISFDLPALGSDLAKALESVPSHEGSWDEIVRRLRASGEEAPAQAAACLATLAIRVGGSVGLPAQRSAVTQIAGLPTSVAFPALTRIFEAAQNDEVRSAVILGLPSRDPEIWTPFLLEKALPSPRPADRANAIRKLAWNRAFPPEVVGRVTATAEDPAPSVRLTLLDYLRAWNSPEAVPTALALLKDSEPDVREGACSTLGMILSKEAAPELLKALADERESVRKEAKQALERIRFYHEEKKRWEEWYKGRGTDPGEGIRKLLEMLDDPNEPIRLSAIESLGTMKAKEALPRLVETIKKGASKAEREAAAKSVERINRE